MAEEARCAASGARELRAGVGVGPGNAAVGGAVHLVGPIGEAPIELVHAGDVHVARDLVAGDLHVADEVSASRNLSGLDHVTPPSVERTTKMQPPAPHATLKSFQEIYIRPKKGEDGLLSA